MLYLDILREQFNNKIQFREKRPGIMQLIAPFYHEDGDMVDIFLQESPNDSSKIRICDYGMTLMHLSYSYDIDTPNKERIFQKIITENHLTEQNGNIILDTPLEKLYNAVFQFAQTIAKVSNMSQFRREIVQSLFYEMLDEFIMQKLEVFKPIPQFYPIPRREELEVDYSFNIADKKPIYLFAVKDQAKARLVTISCLEFLRSNLAFRSVIVHENFDALSKKDRLRLTSAADKQFIDLDDFKENGEQFFEREAV